MSVSRLAGIPLDHVAAELAAFPLVSEAALAIAPVDLDPDLQGTTGRLWRETENALLGSFPAFSIDEVVALRDRVWFAEPGRCPLHRYVRRIAQWYLQVNGPVAVPRLPPEEQLSGAAHDAHTPIARRAWLWLSFALPPDLLLGALDQGGRGPERIELLSPPLDLHLRERGFAETHLHVGAALEFPLLWNLALHAIADPAMRADAFQGPGAGCDEGRKLAAWLVRAALARCVLAAYLERQPRPRDFFSYLHAELWRDVAPHTGAGGFSRLLVALNELRYGRLEPTPDPEADFAQLKALYGQLSGVRTVRIPSRLAQATLADPIVALLPPGEFGRTPEVRFVARTLHYLERIPPGSPDDGHLAALFWQVVRVRSLFYRHVVQRPLTPGLQWFVRFYGRARPARQPLGTRTLIESAARLSGAGVGLKSLEIRTSPEASITANQQYVQALDDIAGNWAQRPGGLELGLVYHFTKQREGGADTGHHRAHWRGSNADPRLSRAGGGNPTGYRYARFYRLRREQAGALAWLLCHRPLSLQVVRGIDVCTDELGVPNWVMAPLLERVRRAAEDGAHALQRLRRWAPPPLRTTVHAGEDFVHLLTGLRSVDEAIDQFGLREGDRIGHGLALGVEPRRWSSRVGRITMITEERLFDLVWESTWWAKLGGSRGAARAAFLEQEIARLSDRVFGQPRSAYELARLRQDLCDAPRLYFAGFPDGPPPDPSRCDGRIHLLCRYLMDESVFERGRQVIWVDPSPEGETLADLQAALRRKLGARGLTVEVNPTSNLLVGDLGDLEAHPLWRLHPPRGGDDAPPVSVCIGSDDPLVFGSNLRHEYQFLSDALTMAGLSDEEGRQWLDRARARGLETRFTRPRQLPDRLLSLLNTSEPRPLIL